MAKDVGLAGPMTEERARRIKELARLNRRRRTLEATLDPLGQLLGKPHEKISIVSPEESGDTMERWRAVWRQLGGRAVHVESKSLEDTVLEESVSAWAMEVARTPAWLMLGQLDLGVCMVHCGQVASRPFGVARLVGSLQLMATGSDAALELGLHTYYYGNGMREYRWHVDVVGERWAGWWHRA